MPNRLSCEYLDSVNQVIHYAHIDSLLTPPYHDRTNQNHDLPHAGSSRDLQAYSRGLQYIGIKGYG
jgi:hypothetical protein